MDNENYNRREEMLKLREELFAVEEDRMIKRGGCTLDELDAYRLKNISWRKERYKHISFFSTV